MLNSLEIKNYRNLKHLLIEKLGRVNLIVGKNNTGKSSLLEAILILGTPSPTNAIQYILEQRMENFTVDQEEGEFLNEQTAKIIGNVFFKQNTESVISIGDKERNITIKFTLSDKDHNFIPTLTYQKSSSEKVTAGFSKGLNLIFETRENIDTKNQKKHTRYISSSLFQDLQEAVLNWKSISLNQEKEAFIIEALSILNRKIEQFNFVSVRVSGETVSGFSKQQPRVRLSTGEITNLRSMGDGINRILTIILAMVNCENGYLLIDEFENGLHYSVQEKLWEIIFHLAKRLNVQVFATTHSSDCINSFAKVLNHQQKPDDFGKQIRLENFDGNIEAIEYDAETLFVATEQDIETR